MSEQEDRENLKALEAELAALAPRADRLDRDRLMYMAGRATLRSDTRRGQATRAEQRRVPPRRRWAWPVAFSAMTASAASLLVALLAGPAPRTVVVEKIVETPVIVRVRETSAVRYFPADPPDLGPFLSTGRDPERAATVGPLARLRSPELAAASGPAALDRILAGGGPSGSSVGAKASPGSGRDEDPATYRKLLDDFLDQPERGAP